MEKIGVAINHPTIPYDENYFRAISEAGIELIEITRYAEDYPGLDYKAIADLAKQYGVGLWSCHLPFYPDNAVNVTTADEALRRRTTECYTGIIEKGTDVGINLFVLHPGNNFLSDEGREEHILRSMESLDRFAEIAASCGATIAVENMIPGIIGHSVEEIERLVSANDKLRLCLDTNHLLKDSHADYIKKFGERIITIHASDYDFKWERHWLPGEGDIDWVELKHLLDEAGYTGPLMYELNPMTPDTITRERPLEYKDYVENARSILAGVAPKPFGRRK